MLKPSAKRAAEAEEQQPAAAAADAAEPWGGLSVGAVVAGGGVVQQVLLRTPEQGGGLLELHVTGQHRALLSCVGREFGQWLFVYSSTLCVFVGVDVSFSVRACVREP